MRDHKNTPAIYVAGKLNDMAVDYLYNVHLLMEWSEKVRRLGFAFYCPAIDFIMGIKFGYKDYHDYFDNGQVWLLKSDAVLVTPGWESSSGTNKEINLALENEIPVFYEMDRMVEYFN